MSPTGSSPAPQTCLETSSWCSPTASWCTRGLPTCPRGASCCTRSWDLVSSVASSSPHTRALPEALIVLASGLSGSRETAQSQVLTGMGLLAGSTVFLLTLLWGTCVVVGKCDIEPKREAVDLQDSKGFSFTGTGVSTDSKTTRLARIMAISVVPLVIAGFPDMMKIHHGQRTAVLLALILSFLLVLSYCLYQISHPWIQAKRLAYVKQKLVIAGILRHALMQALDRLLDDDGTPNEDALRKLFHKIGVEESRTMSRSELHAFVIGIKFVEIDLDRTDAMDAVDRIMDDFGTNHSGVVEEDEFVDGMKRWIKEAKISEAASGTSKHKSLLDDHYEKIRREHNSLLDSSDEAEERTEGTDRLSVSKSVGLLLLGTAMAAAFADPVVDAVQNISNATRIPPFLVSFVVLPLAANSIGEPVSSIKCVSKKKKRMASLTFSELYSGVIMKNTVCLGVILSLIYTRNLRWEFSSEVFMVVFVCVVMGIFTSFRSTFPLWTCLVAYMMYPLSLVVVYFLPWADTDRVVGRGHASRKVELVRSRWLRWIEWTLRNGGRGGPSKRNNISVAAIYFNVLGMEFLEGKGHESIYLKVSSLIQEEINMRRRACGNPFVGLSNL